MQYVPVQEGGGRLTFHEEVLQRSQGSPATVLPMPVRDGGGRLSAGHRFPWYRRGYDEADA